MSQRLDEFGREPPQYFDDRHPAVSAAATAALKRALAGAAENVPQLEAFWQLFHDFVVRYHYGEFVENLVSETREEIGTAIRKEEYKALRLEALSDLKDELKTEIEDELYSELLPEVREEVRERLQEELSGALEAELRQSLLLTLSDQIKQELRLELMQDPELIAAAKADIQRKLLGL